MIGRDEIERSLTGAWRLFLNQPDAMQSFDTSVDGFWRSFQAIVLVAPLYALTALADRHGVSTDANPTDVQHGAFFLGKALTLGLDWIGAADPARRCSPGRSASSAATRPTSSARNWATVLPSAPFAADRRS